MRAHSMPEGDPDRASGVRKPRLWISASAGTGKTFQLTNRYIELLFAGVPLESIVATTFTRKAAGEILDRVFQRLLAGARDDRARQELAARIGRPSLAAVDCEQVLQMLLRQLHRLRVGTIDSLFSQVARCYALELHLPQGWTILDQDELAQRSHMALRCLVESTDVDAMRNLVHMLAKGDAVRSAADLMSDAVANGYAIYRDSSPQAWDFPRPVSSPEVPVELVLEQLRALAERHPKFRKVMEADIERWETGNGDALLTTGVGAKVAAGENRYRRMEIPAEVIAVYDQLLEHLRADAVKLLRLQTQGVYELLAAFDEQMERLRGSGLSFDDVAWYLARFVADTSDTDFSFRLDSQTDHWLLDEFQDTSAIQWRVLKAMMTAGKTRNRAFTLFCVGDAKQAIYGWRGGSARIFASLPDDPDLQPLETEPLSVSWRSSPVVIDTVNAVFTNLSQHNNLANYPSALEWSRAFPVHQTERRDLNGHVVLEVADDEAAVTEAAVGRIAELHRASPGTSIGVLVRKNETVAALRAMLTREKVPASEEGGNPLTDSAAVAWFRAWLKLLDDPHDSVAQFQVLESPLADAVRFSGILGSQDECPAIREGRREIVERGYGATLERLAKKIESSLSARDARRVEQLVELAYRYDRRATLRTADFLALVETSRIADPATETVRVMTIHQSKGLEFDAVFLPELGVRLYGFNDYLVAQRHEPSEPFARVFRRPNKETRRFLSAQEQQDCAASDADHVTELLCLLYVAMTRARHALYMFVPPSKSQQHKLTWSGLLHAALAPDQELEPGATVFEAGDPLWFQESVGLSSAGTSASEASHDHPSVKPLRLKRSAKTNRLPQRVAPSRVAHGTKVAPSDMLNVNREALLRGSIVHAWFEQLTWLDGELPAAQERQRRARVDFPGVAEAQLQQIEEQFQRFCQLGVVQRVLTQSGYLQLVTELFSREVVGEVVQWEVHNEFPLRWIHDDAAMVVGAIDRLVLGRRPDGSIGCAHVIDYKTDEFGDKEALQRRANVYGRQLSEYGKVIAEIYRLPAASVAASLLFLAAGELVHISMAP